MTNAKHTAALEQHTNRVNELRAEITTVLARLNTWTAQLDELADTHQTLGHGVTTDQHRAIRNRQDAADRAAARGHQPRTTPGLDWLHPTYVHGTGKVDAPVTMPVVSVSAEIRTTLQHHIHRLGKPARLAYVSHPRRAGKTHALEVLRVAVDDHGITHLTNRLAVLVWTYTNRPGLEAILRDLDHLDTRARHTINGPDQTNHPDPCPWCGRHTLVITHRAAGRDTAYVTCTGTHPCHCPDQWCPCQRPGTRHRHEWTNSRHDHLNWTRLARDIAHQEHEMTAETHARDTLDQIRQLHDTQMLYPWDNECPTPGEHAEQHIDTEDASGLICVACDPTGQVCTSCHTDDGEPYPWPCPTAKLLDPQENPDD